MTEKLALTDLRREYSLAGLNRADLAVNPMAQFTKWFQQALEAKLPEPNAMTLATADATGHPSARIVLLKRVDAQGFVFFTNYESRKGCELAERPAAALLFHWVELERQVRVEGTVDKVADADSDAYFATRPLDSRIGAWASPQSRVISDRAWLEREFATARERLGGGSAVARPPYWGGYRLAPVSLEFWQGRSSRLHDRISYRREGAHWLIQRLAP